MLEQRQMETATLIYQGAGQWRLCMPQEQQMLACAEAGFLPSLSLPEGVVLRSIVLPLEQLLVRTFQLPLAQPRLIDEEILAQEIEDMTGDEAAHWWLCWQACEHEGGVRGLLLGMPVHWLQEMQAADWCQAVPVVIADAVPRLTRWIGENGGLKAVIDEDATGVFLGVWEQGCWKGMRRLNRREHDCAAMVEEIRASLLAMGWESHMPVAGQMSVATRDACAFENWQGQECDAPAERYSETQRAVGGEEVLTGLNFRRGKWQLSHPLFEFRVWKRPLFMALLLLLVWAAGQAYQLWSLQRMVAGYEARVVAAFRDALPTDPVIDPLAQLQRAAGGATGGTQSMTLLHDIDVLSRVYQQFPWTMKTLQFNGKKFEIRGEIKSLKQLNRLQHKLAQQLERKVEIADTELGDHKVSFRMVWS